MALPESVLRQRPPAEALRWVEHAVGSGARVAAVRWLRGGTSACVHGLAVERPGADEPLRLVLRRHVSRAWLDEEPDLAAREADALRFLESTALPTPELIAVDPDGTRAGVPSVLSTRVPGRCIWHPTDLDSYVRRLAAPLPVIHAVTPHGRPARRRHRCYYWDEELTPPSWSTNPRLWERVLERAAGPLPDDPVGFIHRDYHAGNVLWKRGQVSGVLDWIECCLGSPGVDLAHCRVNLVLDVGLDAADRFLAAWKAEAGVADVDPYWDLVGLVDWFPENLAEPEGRERMEAYTAAVLARLE